jgi:formate/nitrite transporter FocA (FNT family)
VIIFFVLWLAIFGIFYPFEDSSFFKENLYPELVGFGLEGLVLVGIITFLLERKENRRKEKFD